MQLALTSAKGSPGVTTTALALAAAAGAPGAAGREGRALLVEADPAGGDLECWCGPHGEPGLLRAVTDVRDHSDADRLRRHAVTVVPGVDALLAPTTAASMAAAWRTASEGFTGAFAGLGEPVIVDCGRWLAGGSDRRGELLAEADVVVVVCRPTLASVEHARALVVALGTESQQLAVVVVGGARPYGPEEIASALRAPVAGVLPWDQRGVIALVEHGVGRSWLRSPLAIAADEVLGTLTGLAVRQRAVQPHG
jgi:MinD-like ATPase involved in chromosome partitioning or flagellar assembly